jgi:3-hydroxyacyl-CoA dehydrogenase
VESIPEGLRNRFCRVRYFNPPRYMHLVELIGGRHGCRDLDRLKGFWSRRRRA